MKKTDLYLKPGTYIKSSTTQGDVQGISLENFVVSVLNNPTCCAKPVFIKNGMLMTTNYLSGSLQSVLDQGSNTSPLQLSTQLVRIDSNLEVAERLKIESDSTVTTQTSSVVQASTTNASLVLAPNGTGAIIASVPDGTTTGGNARGNYAVDLQLQKNSASQVASGLNGVIAGGRFNSIVGDINVIVGGSGNSITNGGLNFIGGGASHSLTTISTGYSVISGGFTNTINVSGNGSSTIGGGASNNITSQYSTISGGQSNTASTNTHATVVGGFQNTASGYVSIAGGAYNTVSALGSVAIGYNNFVSGGTSFATGSGNSLSGDTSFVAGGQGDAYLNSQFVFGSSGNTAPIYGGTWQMSYHLNWKIATLTTGATSLVDAKGLITPKGNNRAWNVQIDTIAVVTAITGTATGVTVGDVYSEVKNLLFKRIGGTSSIVGSVDTSFIKSNSGMSTASLTVTAGGSQEMALTFASPTFSGGGSLTIRVVSKVSLVEVAY